MMHNPPHPGELLGEDVIKALGLKVAEAARRLGVSRVSLSRVVNGHAAISPELANRLELAGAGTARAWLAMQNNYDLATVRQQPSPPVSALKMPPCDPKHPA
ncbi:HigA family addiction module antitoxin [Aeromonas veronii]|uniref:HigA family addiction module antitoxin n=1 Tax=Aeromonas TaxID=642 RepID=UPI000D3724A2|nr:MULTISPECIES: HigA family addiction module antitoxin [Aeromonas]MBW3808182.1 HigA family addiction module antidote protein [Aeromonas jandaei]PTT45532.1 addiction module antidote protein, HigA family [Aeromonas sp. HMWF014]